MKTISKLLASCLLLLSCAFATPLMAAGEKRIAFVVGNAAYQAGPLATSANDAGLIAQTLQAAGFDVAGARDLDGEGLRAAFHDFLDKAQASGPDTVAFVYLSGYGLQLEGENYFVPVDAKIASAPDVTVEALRISDYTKRLSGLPLKASFIVVDAARAAPFAASGQTLAGGLALAEPEPNMLIAFNAAPGTIGPSENGPYGAYARALTEMIKEGGLSPSQLFDGVRLRVNEETKGAEVPWSASRITAPFVFFERASDAPPPSLKTSEIEAMRSRPMRDLGAPDAYAAAIEQDTMQGYEQFLAAYPNDPLARRVRALLAARREAIVWRRTCVVNSPDAYWSYLERYPHGPHAPDARWRLEALSAPVAPPAAFAPIVYDVSPPPPAEIVYVDRPVLVLNDPAFGFVPPPPIVFLAPVPVYLVFAPPPPPIGLFVLPIPLFTPFPAFIAPPPYVVAPPDNVYFANIHNTTVINNINNTIMHPEAPGVGPMHGMTAAGIAAGAAAGALAARVALPPSLARRSEVQGQGLPGHGLAPPAPGALQKPSPGLPGGATAPNHALPGMGGKPLPEQGVKQGNLPSGPGALPGTPGKALPGPGGKHGKLPSAPPGAALPGAHGNAMPRGGRKPGRTPGELGQQPGGTGKPVPGTDGNKSTTSLGHPGPLPGGRGGPGGMMRPGGSSPPPARPPSPNGAAHPPGGPFGGGGPAARGPHPAMAPQPQRPAPHPPQPAQQKHEHQTSLPAQEALQRRPPSPQPQQWRPPPQQAQQWRPPSPQAQQWRPPQPQQWRPPQQAQWHPAQQGQRACGKPGLPPCR